MSISPESYFVLHDLYDEQKLRAHCEHNSVYCITSPRFPNLVMLHYMDSCQFDKTWTTFSRMSRGLIVDLKHKKIIAHPFDKFFNLGEMPETNYDMLKDLKNFEVSEKLDGSMLILFQDLDTKEFHMTTKGSFDSDHGIYASKLISSNLRDTSFVEEYTLIFELISSKFQIVIDYKKKGYQEGLYLIGMRHRYSNVVLPYKDVQAFAQKLGVPTVQTYTFQSLDEIIENTKNLSVLNEGYVLHYPVDNLRVKIKGTEYLRAHRFISKLSDRYILEYLGRGEENQLLELAPEEYRADVEEKINMYKRKKLDIVNYLYEKFAALPKNTRKEFAMALSFSSEIHPMYQSFLFNILDNKPVNLPRIYALIGDMEKASSLT